MLFRDLPEVSGLPVTETALGGTKRLLASSAPWNGGGCDQWLCGAVAADHDMASWGSHARSAAVTVRGPTAGPAPALRALASSSTVLLPRAVADAAGADGKAAAQSIEHCEMADAL